MKSENLNVGCKIGTEHFKVTCKLQVPENAEDRAKLSKGSDEFQNQMFERGWRIWNQEQSGARDAVEAATVAERKDVAALTAKIQGIIDTVDVLAPAKRSGRPAKPVEVKVDDKMLSAMQAGDTDALQAMLLAAGVKGVSFTK